MTWLLHAQGAVLAGAVVLVAVFAYLAVTTGQSHLRVWTWAWVAYAARITLELVLTTNVSESVAAPLVIGGAQVLNIASGLLLLVGTMYFVGRGVSPVWYGAAILAIGWSVATLAAGASYLTVTVPGFAFLGIASILTGRAWLTSGTRGWSTVVGWAFIAWGVHRLNFPFLGEVEWFAPVGYALGAGFAYIVAFSVLIAHFERVRASLRESERRYRDLFDKSKSVMLLVDPAGGSIVDANEAAERFYGWTRAELTSMRITDINMLSPEEVESEMAKAAEEKRSHFIFPHRRADGSVCDVEVYSGPADIGDRTLLYSIIHDISDRRAAERELAEYKDSLEELVEERTRELTETNERLEAAQRAKDVFLANMSHELRTPLNSVIGFSGLLAKGKAGELTPEQMHQAEMIHASGRHLLALVNDLLDVSAIDSGRTRPSFAVVDVCELVESFARQVEPLCREKGLSLETAVCGGGSHELVTDRRFVEQILWNIVGNAIKFTEVGGITIGVTTEPNGVAIAVTDTGIGIAHDDLGRIFDDFAQLDAIHAAKNVGTGLGLAISQRLAALLDGHLEVESEPGRGSTFTLHVVDHGRARAVHAAAVD